MGCCIDDDVIQDVHGRSREGIEDKCDGEKYADSGVFFDG